MSYTPLTIDGKNFIKHIASSTPGTGLISGTKDKPLPYASSNVYSFTAQAYDHNNKLITTNLQLAEALIVWFEKYSQIYDLDSNIIAAQAYAESEYKIWNYSESGALGVTQFVPMTIWDVMISNNYNVTPKFSDDELNKVKIGLTLPELQTSYYYAEGKSNSKTDVIATNNRLILHQNVINNPEIMIKAQCRLMRNIANNNDRLASSCLFAYNRASGYYGKSYTEIIIKVNNKFQGTYINEGLNYVKRIFGLLADKNNKYIKQDNLGYSFGYDSKIDIDPSKFDSFVADQNNGY